MSESDVGKISLRVVELDDQTQADVAVTVGGRVLHGHGLARGSHGEIGVPELGDRIAVGRALLALGRGLVDQALAEVDERHGQGPE